MVNSRTQVTELDFNQIRENLKTFLSGQSTFSDYNFDGSALSVLIDLLAYNTHYNSLYTNLAINEMFIDSASKRASLVSIGNNFAYLPQSVKCAQATINISNFNQVATSSSLTIPKWSPFQTAIDGNSYTFYTIQDYTATLSNFTYQFNNVVLYEGTPRALVYVCTEENQLFNIPYTELDINTLTVLVQPSSQIPDAIVYSRASNTLQLTNTTPVYYLKELPDNTYQLSFGQNNLGIPISPGNIISITGIVSNKEEGNGATQFSYNGISLGGQTSVTLVTSSFGGRNRETVEELRSNISNFYTDQDRAISIQDYESIINRYMDPRPSSINVWGGENNDPPIYGKVFISIKPASALTLSEVEKTYLRDTILKTRNTVSIGIEFVDPSFIELEITSTVYYNKSLTIRSPENLKTAITNAIIKYDTENLNKHSGVFRYSKLSTLIDNIDVSVTSNITTMKAFINITPIFDIANEYTLKFVNPIYCSGVPEESFLSSGFYIDNTTTIYYLDDNGGNDETRKGYIRLFTYQPGSNSKVIINDKFGTIDYATGSIIIPGLLINSIVGTNFYFILKTESFDVVSIRNMIVRIPSSRIITNVVEDVSTISSSYGNTNYQFTPSRN